MAHVQGPRLDALPTEILWRIARHCPAEVCLNLTQVSHPLRNALLDRLVFKDIIIQNRAIAQAEFLYIPKPSGPLVLPRTRRSVVGLAEDPGQLRSIPPTFTVARLEELLGDDLQAWIKIAIAESKAYQINKEVRPVAETDELCNSAKSLLIKIYKYGAVLSALHREFIASIWLCLGALTLP